MKVRAGVLATLALAAFMDAGHADPDQPAQAQGDRPVSADSDKGNNDQPGSRSNAGSAAGGATENAAEHQSAVKPGAGAPGRGSMWDTPIDTRITVNPGRVRNKGPKGIGAAVKAIAQRLQNKSRTATAPGVTVHHDAHQQQKPAQTSFGLRSGFSRRNAIGASIAPRAATDHGAAPRAGSTAAGIAADNAAAGTPAGNVAAGNAAQQSPAPQGAGTPHASVLAAASAAATGPVPATDLSRAAQPVSRPDVTAHGVAMLPGSPAVNGTAMIRRGTGTGAIGGLAKAPAGVISGANVRMRHP